MKTTPLSGAKLYGIVDFGYVAEDAIEDVAAKLLSGGADILQLRAKGIPLETVAAAAWKIIPHCKAAGVPFIVRPLGVLNRWGWKDRRNLRGNRVGDRGNCSSFKPSPRRRRLRRIHEWLKLISIDQSCKVIRGRHFIDPMARSSGDHCFWQARWVEISPPHRYAETTEPTPIVPAQGRTFSGTESAPFVPPRRRRASSQRCR
jgi:ribosomal protein L32